MKWNKRHKLCVRVRVRVRVRVHDSYIKLGLGEGFKTW